MNPAQRQLNTSHPQYHVLNHLNFLPKTSHEIRKLEPLIKEQCALWLKVKTESDTKLSQNDIESTYKNLSLIKIIFDIYSFTITDTLKENIAITVQLFKDLKKSSLSPVPLAPFIHATLSAIHNEMVPADPNASTPELAPNSSDLEHLEPLDLNKKTNGKRVADELGNEAKRLHKISTETDESIFKLMYQSTLYHLDIGLRELFTESLGTEILNKHLNQNRKHLKTSIISLIFIAWLKNNHHIDTLPEIFRSSTQELEKESYHIDSALKIHLEILSTGTIQSSESEPIYALVFKEANKVLTDKKFELHYKPLIFEFERTALLNKSKKMTPKQISESLQLPPYSEVDVNPKLQEITNSSNGNRIVQNSALIQYHVDLLSQKKQKSAIEVFLHFSRALQDTIHDTALREAIGIVHQIHAKDFANVNQKLKSLPQDAIKELLQREQACALSLSGQVQWEDLFPIFLRNTSQYINRHLVRIEFLKVIISELRELQETFEQYLDLLSLFPKEHQKIIIDEIFKRQSFENNYLLLEMANKEATVLPLCLQQPYTTKFLTLSCLRFQKQLDAFKNIKQPILQKQIILCMILATWIVEATKQRELPEILPNIPFFKDNLNISLVTQEADRNPKYNSVLICLDELINKGRITSTGDHFDTLMPALCSAAKELSDTLLEEILLSIYHSLNSILQLKKTILEPKFPRKSPEQEAQFKELKYIRKCIQADNVMLAFQSIELAGEELQRYLQPEIVLKEGYSYKKEKWKKFAKDPTFLKDGLHFLEDPIYDQISLFHAKRVFIDHLTNDFLTDTRFSRYITILSHFSPEHRSSLLHLISGVYQNINAMLKPQR